MSPPVAKSASINSVVSMSNHTLRLHLFLAFSYDNTPGNFVILSTC